MSQSTLTKLATLVLLLVWGTILFALIRCAPPQARVTPTPRSSPVVEIYTERGVVTKAKL